MTYNSKIRDKVISLRKRGMLYAEIKKRVKCAFSTISYHCKNAGMGDTRDLRKPSKELILEWQSEYDNGVLIKDLATKYDWHRVTIATHCKEGLEKEEVTIREKETM